MNEEEFNSWKEDANRRLEENGRPERVMEQQKQSNAVWQNLTIVFLILVVIALAGFIMWGIHEDKFKSNVNQNVNLQPQINVSTQNDYSFSPSTPVTVTNNYYNNYTILNRVYTNST